jgi:short-subunit dehydrogenase
MNIDATTRVLLTGANGGLGQAMARALKQAGATLVLSGRQQGPLDEISRETGATVILADLADDQQVARLAAEAGPIDVLVANAALPCSGELTEYDLAAIDRALDVNLRSPIALTRALVPGMLERKRGQLVFISSIAGKVASGGTSLYNATKFGLRGFALAMRAELELKGVGVTTVFPGFIRDAGMFAAAGVALPAGVGTRTPQDVADAVLKAIRDNPAEITVAALEQRLGAVLGHFMPDFSNAVQRKFGGEAIGRAVAEGQKHKR